MASTLPEARRAKPLAWITRCIAQGGFPAAADAQALRKAGITHLLNVAEAPGVLDARDGFEETVWTPIADLERIPDAQAVACLDALHRLVLKRNSKVYVHCVGGWNRSPAIVWLYLMACGAQPGEAKQMIVARSQDATPCHPRLIDDALVHAVQDYGATHFLPHPRSEALLPA